MLFPSCGVRASALSASGCSFRCAVQAGKAVSENSRPFTAGSNAGTIACARLSSAVGFAGFAAFAGAKHALRALAQSMARELGPEGVHVAHAVIDGAIDTAWIRANFPG
ncbi:MAG: SDR family oxidoreductase, partial [Acidobacteria bacterium]